MNYKRIYLLTILAACCLAMMGQSVEDQKKEINKIKKNPDKYLYVEIIDSLEDLALGKAQHALQDDIDDYVKQQKSLRQAQSIIARNIKTQTITMPRGTNRYRAFAYVAKADILPASNAVVRENTAAEQKPEAGSTVEPIVSNRHDETLQRLAQLKKVAEIAPALEQMKAEGRIASYVKKAELKGDINQYVLLLCTKEGNVKAVLTEGPQRKNAATGQSDAAANYKGVATMCVKVNN